MRPYGQAGAKERRPMNTWPSRLTMVENGVLDRFEERRRKDEKKEKNRRRITVTDE